jgi:Protein of unknown function (DUF3800)
MMGCVIISVRDLCTIFGKRDTFVGILRVFADESTDKRQRGLLTVGGFMGLPDSFSQAEAKWANLLALKGLEYFRASDAEALTGQFDSVRLQMEPRSARAFEESVRFDLGRIISEEHLGGIALSVDTAGFYKVLENNPDAIACFGTDDPAIWACGRFISECIDRVNADLPDEGATVLSFIFDCHSNWRVAEEAYRAVGALPRLASRFGAVVHADDKKTPALQMADLCAYEARYLSMRRLGLNYDERIEFTCMDKRDAFYSFSVVREQELITDLQNWRNAREGK